MIRKLLVLLLLPFAVVSCESSFGPLEGQFAQAATWWPYRVGDRLVYEREAILENNQTFTDRYEQRVVGDVTIEGKTYQLHVLEGDLFNPFLDSVLYRTEGSVLYTRPARANASEYALADFAKWFVENDTYLPFAYEKDTSVMLQAGVFTQCRIMKGGVQFQGSVYVKDVYAYGVGLVIHESINAETSRLISATIGGISYP